MTPLQQALALREGGQTQRCHTMQYVGPYNVAIHSYNMMSLLLILYEGVPSFSLIRAILLHDTPERWTGDVPTPTKMCSPLLKSTLEIMEQRIFEALGFARTIKDLTTEEMHWLSAIDLLELFMWGKEQQAMGNGAVVPMNAQIMRIFKDRKNETPKPVWDFVQNYVWSRSPECVELLNAVG